MDLVQAALTPVALIVFAVLAVAGWAAVRLLGGAAQLREKLSLNHLMVRWSVSDKLVVAWMSLLALTSFTVLTSQAIMRFTKESTAPAFHNPRFQLALALFLASLTAAESLRRLFRRITAKREAKMRADVSTQLGVAIASICKIVDVKPHELGCGLYLRKRGFRKPSDQMFRAVRLRLLDEINPSGVQFVKGTGTVGQCWESGNPKYRDWIKFNKRYASGVEKTPPSREDWDRLSERDRHGLAYDDWCKLLGRYAEIKVHPITNGKGDIVGILAMDRIWDREEPDRANCLMGRTVESTLGGIAQTLVAVLNI